MNNIIKFIVNIESKTIVRDTYIWNTFAGLLNAMQSVLLLIVLSRTNSIEDAGIYSLAYTTACIFLVIGNYGMRNYQVTDVKNGFSFSDFLCSRYLTCIAMIICTLLYSSYGYISLGYSIKKVSVIILICFLKLIDALEDVHHGRYQLEGRLDIAAKMLGIRLSITIGAMILTLILTHDLVVSCLVSVLITILLYLFFVVNINRNFSKIERKYNHAKVYKLLKQTFAVFVAGFFALYIVNIPKYAIDRYLSQEMQAYYSYIAMPVFVVGLLNNFLYQPILTSLAVDWTSGKKDKFIRRIIKQLLIIMGLIIASLAGAYLLGIPVLSILYNTDLSMYKCELLILLLGGGILAIAGFITVVITIIRCQQDLIIAYITIASISTFISGSAINNWGIMGAACLYTGTMLLLAIIFLIILIYRINTKKNNGENYYEEK